MKRKNWIRFVCIALATVMLAGGATGCAGAGESTSQEVWVNASSKEGYAAAHHFSRRHGGNEQGRSTTYGRQA